MIAVLGVGMWFHHQSEDVIASSNNILQKELILSQIENAFSLIKDAETGQRGFLLSGKEAYLEPYNKAAVAIHPAMHDLQQSLQDDPEQVESLQNLTTTIDGKLRELKLTVELSKSGNRAEAISHLNNDTGQKMMNKIRDTFTAMSTRERAILSQANSRLAAQTKGVTRTFAWLAGISVALFFAFIYLIKDYLAGSRALERNEKLLRENIAQLEAQKDAIQQQKEQAELLNLTHDMILVRDLDGVIRYWNRGAQETYGFTKEQAIGRRVYDLLQTEFPEPLTEIERQLYATNKWDGELIHFSNDKKRLNILSRWALQVDAQGRPQAVLEINSDITARKQYEAALLAALKNRDEQRLQIVFDSAPNGMIMVDKTGHIELVNSQIESLLDYSRQELLGSAIDMLVPESFRPAFQAHRETLLNMTSGEIPGSGLDLYARRKDGKQIPVEIGLNPLTSEGDDFILASVVDITERRRAGALLHEKMIELGRSNDELQQFAYVCSHDLQEPLRVISNYTQLLAKRYRGKLDEKADQFIDFTVDASKRMQILINDLLVFSRLQTKAQEFRPVDCTKAMEMAIANLRVAIDESKATITYDNLPTLSGDPTQVLQLFQNLLGNALKFRSSEAPKIDIVTESQGDSWLFSVRDNGIGFDMQFADRIFVIFQRLHVKEEYSGSGIGLAVCKKIVERHGGRIWVESKPGYGSTFYLTIEDKERHKEHAYQEHESIAG